MSLGASPRLGMKAGARSRQLGATIFMFSRIFGFHAGSEKMAPFSWESIGAHMVVLIAARL